MQSVSSRIWTRVAVSISYDDNDYTTGTSKYIIHDNLSLVGRSPRGSNFEVSKFKLQSFNCVHFWMNTLMNGIEFLYPLCYRFNIIIAVLL